MSRYQRKSKGIAAGGITQPTYGAKCHRPPSIAGIPRVGEQLSRVAGLWAGTSPVAVAVQWAADGSALTGSTGNTLTLTAAHIGKTISLTETGSNGVGSAVTANAANTKGPVIDFTLPVAPPITGGGTTDLTIVYDTSIGNGVDVNGFADLPLNSAASDGADQLTGIAPNYLDATASYNATTHTTTVTHGSGVLFGWDSKLDDFNATYHVTFNYTLTEGNSVYLDNGAGGSFGLGTLGASGTVDCVWTPNGGPFLRVRTDQFITGTFSNFTAKKQVPGAKLIYVNPAIGSDTNTAVQAQSPATPVATIAHAVSLVTNHSGDHVLIAEGSSFSEGLPSLNNCSGASLAYPFVIQSYDPADATNTAKFGRASGTKRPIVNTGSNGQALTGAVSAPANYMAIRGLDCSPGNLTDMVLTFATSNNLSNNGILIENCIFRYTQVSFTMNDTSRANNIIVRNNSFYGAWSSSAHAQGVYCGGTNSFTAEDNVFYHCGWKFGANRDDDPTIGGTTIFRHSIYQQDTTDGIVRRNLFIDPSATGASLRGNVDCQQNVFIDCPLAIIAGKGDSYDTIRPTGVDVTVAYNAILGDADINTLNARGQAITTGNGRAAAAIHHNLIARSRNPSGGNVFALSVQSEFPQPSHADFHDNVEYLYAAAGKVYVSGGAQPTYNLPTFEANAWSDPTSGSNVNVASHSMPNPYTAASLYAALGYADKAALVADVIANPEKHVQRTARALLFAGYGIAA